MLADMPMSNRHLACVRRLNRYFNTHHADRVLVGIHDSIRLTDGETATDCVLLVPQDDCYVSRVPEPGGTYLLIEVADNSFEYDRDVKGPLYAANGVCEYWIVNLNDETVHRYRGPQSDGTWITHATYYRDVVVTISALPGVEVAVADILP
jgi:Uma2 family endonuclease